jgi:hypothetical protein
VTPDARAARERKQKIFVLAGGLFLVALLAIQLPKLLGGSSPAAAATTTDTTTPEQAAPAPAGTTTPVAVVGAAPTSAATTEKLTSFTVFAPKDPFVQQVVTQNGITEPGGTAPTTAKGGGEKTQTPSATFTTGAQAAAAVTIVTVNGARQIVEPGMKFPAGDPLFVLVAEKPGSKSVVVGIAGGAYTGGHKTATLKVGKPRTLVNTTTGARYKISLVSVGSGEADQPAPKP